MGRLATARTGLTALVTVLTLGITGALTGSAGATTTTDPPTAEPVASVLDVTGPSSGRFTSRVPLVATLTGADGAPLSGQAVEFQRLRDGEWTLISHRTTDETGQAHASPTLSITYARFRVVFAGNETHAPATSPEHPVRGYRHWTVLKISGAQQVVDERRAPLVASWHTLSGKAVPGVVRLYSRPEGGSWHLTRTGRLGPNGYHVFRVRPRVDTRYMMRGVPLWWARSDASPKWTIDNLPPARPWRAPAAAPDPRPLPDQRRGFGPGAYVNVWRIPDGVWRNMTGISWHRGCPVGRNGLRLIRANYWGFDGYRHRGELIVSARIVDKYAGVLRDLYAARIPIRAMYRVDRFGYSSVSGGGDDYASMRHDNTSAFNCRWVTGNPGVRSPHSTGRAFDINTWENPFRSNWGWLPNRWWVSRSDPRVAWRSTSHEVVRILRANGFRWSYGTSDSQHFDGKSLPVGGTFTG